MSALRDLTQGSSAGTHLQRAGGRRPGRGRQLEDCRRLARELGWIVAEEYVDNDLSAYSGKARPAYERMLADLDDGARDAVVVYHTDRLTRRPIELEQFVNVLTGASVHHVRLVAGGDLDVGNGDGLLVARMMSAVAANESATKSRRVRRKMDEVAASGMPHGGYIRPFGFEDDKITHRPQEAEDAAGGPRQASSSSDDHTVAGARRITSAASLIRRRHLMVGGPS